MNFRRSLASSQDPSTNELSQSLKRSTTMASENDDPFDGASPSASHTQEPDTYDDLLGVQVPIGDLDMSMLDFQEEHTHSFHTPPTARMTEQQTHNAESAGLDASLPTLKIKKEALDVPFTSGIAMNSIDDPVEISDTEDPDSIYKYGTTMSDGVIFLSDGEDPEEIIVFDDGSTSVTIKKENPDVELLGATRGLVEVSDSDNDEPPTGPAPKLGSSFLRTPNPRAKRTPADIGRMQQIQRLYAERALGRNLGPGAGKSLASPHALPSAELTSPNHSSGDGFAWMSEVINLDDGPTTDFRELKKEYKAKRKARQNTLEDDVQFKKAQNEENQRLKRLAQETADTDSDDEAEESDDGLFVPQGTQISLS